MPASYLLPCSCGKQITVQVSQAGDQVACSCGAKLDVPTLRQLKALEPAETAPDESGIAWGPQQGMLFCGGAVLLVAICVGSFYYLNRPKLVKLDDKKIEVAMKQSYDSITLTESWVAWNMLKESPLEEKILASVAKFESDSANYERRMWVVGILAGIGVLLMLGASLWKAPNRVH